MSIQRQCATKGCTNLVWKGNYCAQCYNYALEMNKYKILKEINKNLCAISMKLDSSSPHIHPDDIKAILGSVEKDSSAKGRKESLSPRSSPRIALDFDFNSKIESNIDKAISDSEGESILSQIDELQKFT